MKMRALVVSDNSETRKNKEGVEKTYRTLAVVDQDDEGATLETMVKIGVNPDDSKASGKNLAGKICSFKIRDISQEWRGVSLKADLSSIDGSNKFVPEQKAA